MRTVRQRGTVILDHRQAGRLLAREHRAISRSTRQAHDAVLSLAGVPLRISDEVQHFKCIGITGSGKTTAIAQLIGSALARGDRAIIADPDGTYSARFYNQSRGDMILNPFDPQSARWDLFGEVHEDFDIEDLSRALIPDAADSRDNEWREYARTFFTDTTQRLWRVSKDHPQLATVGELHRLLTRAPTDELRQLLQGSASAAFLDNNAEKMFASIRAVTSSAVRSFAYVSRQQGTPLSVRDWVRVDKPAGGSVLFMPYHAGQIEALRSTISAWMRLGIFQAMNREQGDQRLWFVVDELGALGRIGGLTDGLTRLRKFGGRVVLGFQSIDQVESLYGRNDANSIVENCGNTLLLRCGGSDQGGTAAFASKLVGEREMLRKSISRTRRNWFEIFASATIGEQLHTDVAVMASQFEQLPVHQGYLRVGSRPEWLQVAVTAAQPASGGRIRNFLARASRRLSQERPQSSLRAADAANSIASFGAERSQRASVGAQVAALPQEAVNGLFVRDGRSQRYLYQQTGQVAFQDEGLTLSTQGEDARVIHSLVQIAQARGWQALLVHGSEGFRREVWNRAASQGIAVTGYVPTPEERGTRVVDAEQPCATREPLEAPSNLPERPLPQMTSVARTRFTDAQKLALIEQATSLYRDQRRYRGFLERERLSAAQLEAWSRKLLPEAGVRRAGSARRAARTPDIVS